MTQPPWLLLIDLTSLPLSPHNPIPTAPNFPKKNSINSESSKKRDFPCISCNISPLNDTFCYCTKLVFIQFWRSFGETEEEEENLAGSRDGKRDFPLLERNSLAGVCLGNDCAYFDVSMCLAVPVFGCLMVENFLFVCVLLFSRPLPREAHDLLSTIGREDDELNQSKIHILHRRRSASHDSGTRARQRCELVHHSACQA